MPDTTDKDREDAKKLCEKLRVIVNGENCYPFDEPEHIENLALWIAHLRSEAATEKEREMMHQINTATQKVIRLSSGEYVNAVAWIDAMEKEAKAETLREAVNRVHGIKLKWRKNDTARIKDYKQAANESLDHAIAAILSASPSADGGGARECVWTEDTDGLWKTSCGRSWTFIEGGPEANRVRYCHGCGNPVRIADEPNKEE